MNPFTTLYCYVASTIRARDEAGISHLVEALVLAAVMVAVILASKTTIDQRIATTIGNLFDSVDGV